VNKKTILHLARHGQTHWNIEHRIQGQLDSTLTRVGEQQALELAERCLALNINQILTSSLGRAVQTAVICGQHLQLKETILAGIEERNFGLWQGELTPTVQSHPNYAEITSQLTDCKPEQGESAQQLLTRFEQALKHQLQQAPDDNYLIITHGDVLRCFMTQFHHEGQLSTGYDYKNGHYISICYDHQREQFTLL